MIKEPSIQPNQNINNLVAIQRLTALWALSECGLGGIMHAVKSPFTGLLVGSISVAIIALIATWSKRSFRAISTSLIIVLFIKMTISPHSSVMSYFAVSFQAILGYLLFRFIPFRTLACVLLSSLTLAESAIQKVISLTIIYGKNLWEAIDIWGDNLLQQFSIFSTWQSSQFIVTTYVGGYFLAGLFIGFMIARLIRFVHQHRYEAQYQIQLTRKDTLDSGIKKRKPWLKLFLFFSILIVIALTIIAFKQENGWTPLIYFLTRMVVVLSIWMFVISPFIMKILKSFLFKRKSKYAQEIATSLAFFPYLRFILAKAWKESLPISMPKRFFIFLSTVVLYTLNAEIE